MILEYAQFGVAIFAIAALAFCISRFLDHMKHQEASTKEFMKHQEQSFKNTVDNHLDSLKEASIEQTKVNTELCRAVDGLLRWLQYVGPHKKNE